jgi:hypothetical protein
MQVAHDTEEGCNEGAPQQRRATAGKASEQRSDTVRALWGWDAHSACHGKSVHPSMSHVHRGTRQRTASRDLADAGHQSGPLGMTRAVNPRRARRNVAQ